MGRAAIFDLDRTLIAGSSAEVFARVLADVGVEVPAVPGRGLYFRLFELFGEDPITMRLAGQGARLFAGQRVATIEAAGLLAADVLAGQILPHASVEIDRHRDEGATVVLATSSPLQLVRPLAEALGFHDVVATRYRVVDGCFDGTLDGPYLWGGDKAAAVTAWAERSDIELGASTAYSDSWYDVPMLELVGTPVAVNPDVRLRALATARRWLIRDFTHPAGVGAVAGFEGQEILFPWLDPELSIFADIRVTGAGHLPLEGPAIVAANHRSYFDPIALGYLAASRRRPMRFLAKKEVLEAPVLGALAATLGTIPVDRGTGSSAPLDLAARALDAGEVVVILPQATIPRGEDFFKAKLRGHSGAVRLAQRTGAPLVPVGLWGTEQVWPRNSRLPRVGLTGDRPSVRINVGEPYTITQRSKPRPATEQLMGRIVDLLPAEARHDRTPTEEELAQTFPPSRSSD